MTEWKPEFDENVAESLIGSDRVGFSPPRRGEKGDV